MDRPNFVADERHGPLPAVLLVLTFVSGLIDAISIISLGHVFVANMTGNIVFVGFAVAGAPGFSLRNSLFALAGFVVGAIIGGRMLDRWGPQPPDPAAQRRPRRERPHRGVPRHLDLRAPP